MAGAEEAPIGVDRCRVGAVEDEEHHSASMHEPALSKIIHAHHCPDEAANRL